MVAVVFGSDEKNTYGVCYLRPVLLYIKRFFSATKNIEYQMSPLAKVLFFTLLFPSNCVGVSLSASNTGPNTGPVAMDRSKETQMAI